MRRLSLPPTSRLGCLFLPLLGALAAATAASYALPRRVPAPAVPAAAVLPTPAAPAGPRTGALFAQNCSPCHGTRGAGRIGPQIAARSWSAAVFNLQVRQGGLVMPAFPPAKISGAQLAQLLTYVNRLPPPPAAALLPPPDPKAPGALVFQQNCLACHGAEARGGIGPGILNTALPQAKFLFQVRHGGGLMPAFAAAQLSPAQARQIYAWLHPPPRRPDPGRDFPLPYIPNYVSLSLFFLAALALAGQAGSERRRKRQAQVAAETQAHQKLLQDDGPESRLKTHFY